MMSGGPEVGGVPVPRPPLELVPRKLASAEKFGRSFAKDFDIHPRETSSPMMVQMQHRPGGTTAPLTTGCVITTGRLVDLTVGNQEQSTISFSLVGVASAAAIFIVISRRTWHVGARWPARAGDEDEVHSQQDYDVVRVSRFIGFGVLMRLCSSCFRGLSGSLTRVPRSNYID